MEVVLRSRVAVSVLLVAFSVGPAIADVVTVERERVLMGTRCSLVLQGEDAAALETAATRAFETIAHLEDVASNWNDQSELSRFNAAAVKANKVPASADLYDVLARATAWSVRSQGA